MASLPLTVSRATSQAGSQVKSTTTSRTPSISSSRSRRGLPMNSYMDLSVRHDHGPAYMADDFHDELNFLGIESSPSFVREPEGNGCAERFIGLLKENLLWVRTFSTIEELRQALIEFKQQYNEQWILQRHDYKTPAQVRQEKRQIHYAEAAG